MEVLDNRGTSMGKASAPFSSGLRSSRFGSDPAGTTERAALKLCLVLLPGFSQLSLSSFVDPFRCVNKLMSRRSFNWQTFGIGTGSVASSSGMSVEVDASVDECNINERESALVLIGGDYIEDRHSPRLRSLLRRHALRKIPIYAIGTATWLLAEAGVLRNGARCTVHWSKLAALCETFQDLAAEDVLFVHDGNFTTCAGELSAFDLATEMIEARCGSELALRVCEQLTADKRRSGGSYQSIPPGLQYAGAAKKVLQAIKIMEKNTEDLLSLDDLARHVSLSRRQVERLFEKHLGTTPYRYYMSRRLHKAKQLLETTSMPIIDIAVACGYISSSHFSKSFKDHFRQLPSRVRASAIRTGHDLQA